MKLIENIQNVLRLQDYSARSTIEGVKIIPLRRFNDEGGSFTELARLDQGQLAGDLPFALAQINYSEMEAGAIKAFHLHEQQTDIWYVPPSSKMLLILVDLRQDSATKNQRMRLILGDGNSQLILIPPGVAHGCKSLGSNKSTIIYFIDRQFSPDPESCDEKRLPWNYWGEELWDIIKE
jgi:dTDP-4-dehydrorhamnose 3,5-epimerase